MIDAISAATQVYSPYAMRAVQEVQPQSTGMEVATSMLEKSLDTQSIALTQLLNNMGIGNNIDALA